MAQVERREMESGQIGNWFKWFPWRETKNVVKIKCAKCGELSIAEYWYDDRVIDCNGNLIDVEKPRICYNCVMNECKEDIDSAYCLRKDCRYWSTSETKNFSSGKKSFFCIRCYFNLENDLIPRELNYMPTDEAVKELEELTGIKNFTE